MTANDLKLIDDLIKKNLHGVATKKDIRVVEARLDGVESKMATKDDLKNFATKKDLQSFATKKDLQSFATKKDLQSFATKHDLDKMKKEFKNDVDDAVAQIISVIAPLEERVEKIEDRLGIINP